MLRSLRSLPLRRVIHTSSTRQTGYAVRSRAGLVLGASVAVTGYVAWKSMTEQAIALDSVASSSTPIIPKAKPTSDPVPTTVDVPPSEQSADEPLAPPELEKKLEEAEEANESTEESGGSSGAFNPVTGEINWDCPCLGGMAYGPCGMQFREAFSCFVFSEQEPKGIDCVEKFKAMQDCFREHPEVYADEIMDDDDDVDAPGPATSSDPIPTDNASEPSSIEPPVQTPSTDSEEPSTSS